MSLSAGEKLEHLRLATEVSGLGEVEVILPAENDVALGGIRLHYLDWGEDGHPPVLFLHGGALTAHTWDVVCLTLRRDYRCLALDQRGHGDSEWSPGMEYGVEDHLGDVERFIDHLGLDRFVLAGQSMGAINSIVYATRHSDRLAGLVSVDAGLDVRPQGASRIVDFVKAPGELDSVEEFVQRAQDFNPARDPRLLRTSLLHNLRRLPNGRWTWKYDRRPLQRDEFHLTEGSRDFISEVPALLEKLRGMTGSIRCPTLIVRGERSDVLSDADAKRFADLLPDGRWTRVAGAGHTVQGDNPRGLAEALRGFFAEIGF
jgi:pimeloyl-ACP methyl ester carboxylesterase